MTRHEKEHLELIRERFTRTAEEFSKFVEARRAGEGERLTRMLLAGWVAAEEAFALDVACGPGTFTLPLAARTRKTWGLDFTAAMLEQARAGAKRAGRRNTAFLHGSVYALPFRDAALDAVICGYCFHHFQQPDRALAEMLRVTKPGGRVGLADLVVPLGGDAKRHDAIERARDPSHASTLTAIKLRGLFATTGLRVIAEERCENVRAFEEWMRVGGHEKESNVYGEVEALMEATLAGDAAGFRPRRNESGGLEFVQTTLFLIAEKPR
ncbi:MAG: methyltransferase domain-containing protein [Candidatus Acidiferrales bacterium]